MKKKERGAITIEASIILPLFIFAIVTIIMIIDICIAQAKIGIAIDATAKEISQYSYLYGLTGLNQLKRNLNNNAAGAESEIDNTMQGINNIFNAIEDMGETGRNTNISDPNSLTESWKSLTDDSGKINAGVDQIKSVANSIKDDPKGFIFGIARLAGRDLLDVATSRLIAAPIAEAMVQKHLKNTDDQDAESYLKGLGVQKGSDGTYVGGLDFTESTLFLYGCDEIRIVVKYKVKVIPLLPIDMEYNLRQVAVTKGWLGGDCVIPQSQDDAVRGNMEENQQTYVANNTFWTETDPIDRGEYIISRELAYRSGYSEICGVNNRYKVYYNSGNDDFLYVASTNMLYSTDINNPKKVSDITDNEIKEYLDTYVYNFSAQTDGMGGKEVTYKGDQNKKEKKIVSENYTKTFVLVVPEDEGLKERIEDYAKTYNSDGVKIEVVSGYGKGAAATAVPVETEAPAESEE